MEKHNLLKLHQKHNEINLHQLMLLLSTYLLIMMSIKVMENNFVCIIKICFGFFLPKMSRFIGFMSEKSFLKLMEMGLAGNMSFYVSALCLTKINLVISNSQILTDLQGFFPETKLPVFT